MIRNKIKFFLVGFLAFLLIFLALETKIFDRALNHFLDRIFYKNIIQYSAAEFKVDPILIFSVITEESKFNNKAISGVGALGLMQLMPRTSREIAGILEVKHFSVDMLDSPPINIRFGSYYLQKLIARYDGNLVLAISAYNAGIRIVDSWIYMKNGAINQKAIKDFEIKDIQYKSTRIFVKKVFRNYKILKRINGVLKIFR